jgi:hypothetical protein
LMEKILERNNLLKPSNEWNPTKVQLALTGCHPDNFEHMSSSTGTRSSNNC